MIQQAYGRERLSQAQVFRWHKMFKEGRESVEEEPHAGRPSTSRTTENEQSARRMVNTDRRSSVRMIAEQLRMDKMVAHKIISLLERIEEDPNFFDNVITGDESWFFQYYPETKHQSNEWHTPPSPRQKKARMSKSRMKAMLTVFFDKNGVVHSEFVPEGQTVNGAFYVEVLKRLKRRVNRVRPEISASWKLHHDNAPSHTCFVVTEHLTKNGIVTIPQPPYSPDLAPEDLFLFPKVKTALKGRHHRTLDDVKRACTHALKDVSVGDFQGAYEVWKRRLQKCVRVFKEHILKTAKVL
ncbi:mariner Mos1 transposase [Trichonephila clavipes]|nr:mariner Mos1 transposase [Trichonephila clavipes]